VLSVKKLIGFESDDFEGHLGENHKEMNLRQLKIKFQTLLIILENDDLLRNDILKA
jgi:hypothetical protein